METIRLWARHGDAVRQAMELGEPVHLETAKEELTDEFLLFALARWIRSREVTCPWPQRASVPELPCVCKPLFLNDAKDYPEFSCNI